MALFTVLDKAHTLINLIRNPRFIIPLLKKKLDLRQWGEQIGRSKIVTLPVDDLIFPNRLDIWLRVMSLWMYDNAKGKLELSDQPYY